MLADVYADASGLDKRRVSVVKLPKSGGVVQRSKKYRQRVQNQQIKVSQGDRPIAWPQWPGPSDLGPPGLTCGGGFRSRSGLGITGRDGLPVVCSQVYFEGDAVRLSPHKVTLNWDAVKVYRVGGGPQAPRSALPIGEEPSTDPLRPALVPLSRELVHNVLAVSWAQDEKDLLTRSAPPLPVPLSCASQARA